MPRHLGWPAALGLAIAATGCLGQPERTFFNDQGVGDDASVGPDSSGADGADGGADAGGDVATEATIDSGGMDALSDTGTVEAGCGPTNTISNCGACGQACDTTESIGASCNGVTCSYTGCQPGFADCDMTAPDTHGCSTATDTTTNCTGCNLACDTSHSTGASCDGTTCSYSGCDSTHLDCVTTPPDLNGCETTIGLTNCAACGTSCPSVGTLHTAAGTTCTDSSGCQYTCSAGYTNCDTTPPNTSGCECNTPAGCCAGVGNPASPSPGNTCQTTHNDGFGHHFYDCEPTGTYNDTQAMEAANADSSQAGVVTDQFCCGTGCTGNFTCDVTPNTACVVCKSVDYTRTTDACTCWTYVGIGSAANTVGHALFESSGSGLGCRCPASTDPSWD